MSKAKTETKMDSFQSWAHRWGRVGTLIALIYMVALPFVVLAAYDSIPSLGEVFNVNTFSIVKIKTINRNRISFFKTRFKTFDVYI